MTVRSNVTYDGRLAALFAFQSTASCQVAFLELLAEGNSSSGTLPQTMDNLYRGEQRFRGYGATLNWFASARGSGRHSPFRSVSFGRCKSKSTVEEMSGSID